MTSETDTAEDPDTPKEPQVDVPELIDLNEFLKLSLADMQSQAQELGLRVAGVRSKHQLAFEILTFFGRNGTRIEAEGVLDYNGENYGFLRWPELSFMPNVDDVYVSPSFIRQYELKLGNLVKGVVRAPRDREKFLSLDSVLEIEGVEESKWSGF